MTPPPIDSSSLALPAGQYVRSKTAKSLVVLHHTAGGSAESSVRWWKQTASRIATAFIIGRDGTVYQSFDPDYWAYHLGIGGSIEKRSVGIELANWGPLTRKGSAYRSWAGGPVDVAGVHEHPWRGERYWEAYPDAQVEAAVALTVDLCGRYGIDRDAAPAQLGTPDTARFRRFRGVVAHHHVRADKTDVSPAFPWERLTEALEGGPSTTAPACHPDTDAVYTVEAGDTLWGLGRRFGVGPEAIQAANSLIGSTIVVGQRLVIP